MNESEDNMADGIKMENSTSAVKIKPKKRSLVERELETTLTARVTSPATSDGSSTSRYGRARRHKTDSDFYDTEKAVTKALKSPQMQITPVKSPLSAYKMHASNSAVHTESPKRILSLEGTLENQIENIYNANISLSRFGSDEKKNVSPSPVKKFPKVYIRKDLIQTKDKEETVTLIKNMFSPQKSARKTNSHLSNVLERSSEKFNLNGTYSKPQNGYLDNLSVVKTLDFDGNKKKKRNSTEIKSNLSKNELFELEAKCMYQVGDLVWARMGTFPFWPSIITREPGSEMFVRKKMFGKVERDIIHVTFFGDNGRRSWVLDSMLRRYQGLAEFEAARDAFTPEAKRKDPRLHNAFFISQKKLALWHMSIEETETLQREPKRFRIDILNQMLGNTKSKVTPKAQKSGKITRTDSDVSLSESLYDSLFSEDDVKNDDADRSRNKTRNKSLDVSEVVTACLDNMAARTGITMIQKQSHMDIWLQKAKSQTPEKSQLNITVTMERLDSEKPKPKEKECIPSAKKKKRDFTKVPTQKPYSLRKSTTESQNLLSHHNEHDYSKTAISENNEQNDNTIETDNHICVIDKVVSLSNAATNNNNEDSQVITENNENIDKNVDDCSNNIYNFEIDQEPESPTFTQVFDEEIQVSHEQNFNKDNNLTNITETFEVSVEKVTETNEKNEKSDELTLTETEHVSSSDINFQLGSEKKVKNIDDNMIPEILSSTEEISRNKETVADIPETNENDTSEIVQILPLSNENLPCTKKKTKSVFLDKTVECDSIAIEENTTIEQDQTTSKQSFPDNQKSANLEEITGDISNVDNNMSVDEIIDSPHEVTSNDQEIIVANTNILPEEETSIDKTENNTKMLDNEPISEKTSVNDGQEMAANGVIDDKDDLSNLTISKVKDIDQLSDDLFDEDDIDDNRDISMIDEENLLKDDPTDKSVTEKTDDKDRGQETNFEIENTVKSKNIDVESNFNEPVINDNVCDSIDDVSVLENGHTEQTDKNTEATSTEVDTADNISLNSVSVKEISFEPDTLSIDSLSSDLSEPCLPQITEVVSISEKDISSSTDDDIRPGRSKRTMILDSDNESMSSLDEITLSELQRRTRSKSLQMATQHTENSIDSVKSDKSESRKLRVVLKDCLLIKDNKLPAIKQISSNTNAEIEISETQLDVPLKARKLRLRRSLPPPKIVKPAETETIPNPKETETTVNHVKTEPPDEAAEITKPVETVTPEKPIKTEETIEGETYSKSVKVKQVATSAETEILVKSKKTVTVNGFHDSKEPSPDRTIKEPEPDTVSINSSDSGASIKRRGKKTRTDSEKMRDPEFLKYVELRQDALMDDHPELTQEEIIAYLFKTWEYEENRKSDFKKNDDIEQSNLVKGTSTSNEPLRKKKVIRPKKVIDIAKVMKDVNVKTTNKNNIVAVEDVKPRELPKRKSVQPFYKEDYSDIEDEIELFEIFKPKKKDGIKSEPKEKDAQNDTIKIKTEDQAVKVKTEVPKVDSNTDDAKDTKEEIEISDQEEEFEEYYDEAEAYFEQLTKPKPNVFKGLLREKVCEICEETSNLVKCKGCNGMFHVECVNKVEEIIEVPAPTRGRKKKVKKPRGRRPKVSTESNGDESYSDEKQDANVSTEDVSFEEVKEPKPIIISDADDFEAQIAEKMKEMIEIDTIQYDSYSSDDGIDWSETVAGKCEIVDIKIKPKIEPVDYSDFKCKNCQKNDVPICFVCKSDVSPKGKIERRQKCQVAHCHKYYHLECLDHWPQTQFTSGEPSRNNKKIDEHFEAITCPRHVCHTCVCDDPRGCKTRFSGDKLARCVRCPATYHSFTKCLPAGSQILSTSHIVCPRHHEHRPGKVPCHVNTGWCFICALGGTLICCEYCPTSFHADCLNIEPPEGGYMCEDCETGRLPLYGEMVWVKLGHYRWWPGIILHPSEIPDNIMAVKHSPGEFVVRFFGQYDHYWVNRGRVFPFQEGDSGRISGQKSKIDEDFTIAMEHAKRAFEILKNVEPNDEENQDIASSLLPPHYVKLKVNRPCGALYGKKVDLEESSLTQCECSPDEEEPCGPYSHCLNRMLLTECGPICRAGDRCQNRAFEKRLYPKLVPYRTSHRGWGLKTLEDVKAGQFVIEYVGELIDEEEFRRRMRRMHEMRDENFYFLTLDKERMIDAGPKGNLARFMNHCCEPNCETQKWTVLGDIRVGLFAIHDIPANTEVTFNYNLECTGIEKKQCMCGAKRCSGYIGEKPKQDEPQSKKPKIPAKRTYKKRKTIESPSTSKNGPKRPVGRPPKPRELTDIEKDLLIIKNATNGISSDSESERLSVESEKKDPKALKRKRVSFSTEDKIFVYNGTSSPSVKRMKLDNEVGD